MTPGLGASPAKHAPDVYPGRPSYVGRGGDWHGDRHDNHHGASINAVILRCDDDYDDYWHGGGYRYYGGSCWGYDPFDDYYCGPYWPSWWRSYYVYDTPVTYAYPTYETYNQYTYYETPPAYGDSVTVYNDYVPADAGTVTDANDVAIEGAYPGERLDAPPPQDDSGVALAEITPGVNAVIDEGLAAFAVGRFEEARRAFVRVSLEDRGDAYAMLLYGWTWFAVGDHEIAAAAIRGAMGYSQEAIHHPIDLRTLYGDAAAMEGRIEQLGDTVQQFPTNRQARFLYGYALTSTGRFAEALDALRPLQTPTADDPITDSVVAALEATLAMDAPVLQP